MKWLPGLASGAILFDAYAMWQESSMETVSLKVIRSSILFSRMSMFGSGLFFTAVFINLWAIARWEDAPRLYYWGYFALMIIGVILQFYASFRMQKILKSHSKDIVSWRKSYTELKRNNTYIAICFIACFCWLMVLTWLSAFGNNIDLLRFLILASISTYWIGIFADFIIPRKFIPAAKLDADKARVEI